MHVLLCEDNKEMYLHLEEVINKEYLDRCFVHIAKNGHQALEIAKNFNIDIFIIDLDLPDMGGVNLAEKLRKKYLFQPIIIESACNDSKVKEIIQDKISYYAFLSKPFDNNQFLTKFSNAYEISKYFSQKKLRIKMNRNFLNYDIKEVICIQKINSSKKIEIVSYDDKVKTDVIYHSLSKVKQDLKPANSLIQVHKSFLINPDYIQQVDMTNRMILLKHLDFPVPIGGKYSNILKFFI